MSISHQPHDKYFKASLKERQIAVDFLKSHLQPGLYQRLDLSTLHLTDKSLGMSELREMHCDIVYKCTIDGKDGISPSFFNWNTLPARPSTWPCMFCKAASVSWRSTYKRVMKNCRWCSRFVSTTAKPLLI